MEHDKDVKILLRKADRIIRNAESISGNHSGTEKSGSVTTPAKKISNPGRYSQVIMDRGLTSREQLVHFIIRNNTGADHTYVTKLVTTYIAESKREGVNHDVAVCQMCLETGFLRFTGSVSHYQNNFCGLGATDPWSAGDSFRNMEEGVRAHIQHLKAYACNEPLVPPLVDPRWYHVKRGSARTIHELAGRWASDPDYGLKIEGLLKQLCSK